VFPCEPSSQRGYLRFSRDGNRVAIGYGKVQLWDLAAKAQLLPAAGKPEVSWDSEYYSCLSPDGRTVLHGGRGNLAAFDVATGTLHPLPLDGSYYGTAVFSPDGKFVAVGQAREKLKEGKALTVFDLTTYTEKAALPAFDAGVYGLGYTPDGSELFAFFKDRDGTRLLRLDPGTLKQRGDLPKVFRDDWTSLVFSPDSKLVGFFAQRPSKSGPNPGALILWDIAAGRVSTALTGGESSDLFGFVAGGALFAKGNSGGVTFSDVRTGQVRKEIFMSQEMLKESGHPQQTQYASSWDVASTVDGRWLAAGAPSGHVYFWDVSGGQMVGKFKAHLGGVKGLAFSPDGRFLVTIGEEKKLKVWSMDGAAPPGR
jgi:WD40 repeat protein